MIYHFKTHRARQLLYALENFNEKTMKEVILKKAMGANDVRTNTEECVAYYAFSMYGYDWVVHEEVEETNHGDFPCWEISELSTGGRIPFDVPCMERQDAIDRAQRFLEMKGPELTRKVIEGFLQQINSPSTPSST